jgi:hypothetical protein
MAAKFEIVLTDGGGSSGGGGGGQGGGPGGNAPARTPRPAWALDPATDTPLNRIPNAKPAGLFSGGMQQAIGLAGMAGMGGIAGSFGRVGSAYMGAGPVGATLAGADEAGKVVAGAINAVGQGARAIGGALSSLAGNDHLGMFTKAIGGTADVLEKIPIAGQIYGAYLRTAGAAVEAFTGVVNAFVDRGEVLGRYSGAVASSRAGADVRSLMSDIREAQVLGADTANLTDATSRFYAEMREILLPIKQFVLTHLVDFMRGLTVIAETAGPQISGIFELQKALVDIVVNVANREFAAAAERARTLPEKIAEAMKRTPPEDILMDTFFRMMRVGGDFGFGPRGMEALQQKLNAPAMNLNVNGGAAGGF